MARARRAKPATAPATETVVAAPEDAQELVEIEVTAEDLEEDAAFAVSALPGPVDAEDDDPYGFNDEDDDEIQGILKEIPVEVVGNLVEIQYKGLRNQGRSPDTIELIVPNDGTEPDDPEAIITDGTDYRLRRDVPVYVSPEHAAWIIRHPTWLIEKA